MKYIFENIGPIDRAEMELGDLTILAGENNTGKSYLAYCVWYSQRSVLDGMGGLELIENTRKLAKKLKQQQTNSVDIKSVIGLMQDSKLYKRFQGRVVNLFKDKSFEKGKIILESNDREPLYDNLHKELEKRLHHEEGIFKGESYIRANVLFDAIMECLKTTYFSDKHYLLTTERAASFLFEYHVNRSSQSRDISQNVNDSVDTEPINYGFRLVANIKQQKAEYGEAQWYKDNSQLESLFQNIFRGRMEHDELAPYFIPEGNAEVKLEFRHIASSNRSLAMFYYTLKYFIKDGDLIVIDEPESYLNPKNQILLARIFALCINAGVKILFTTHSDLIIRELDTLLMLNHDFPDKAEFMGERGYTKEMILSVDKINPYITKLNEKRRVDLEKAPLGDMGMDIIPIDQTIEEQEETSRNLVYKLMEKD